jgi:predicted phosphodiesterase
MSSILFAGDPHGCFGQVIESVHRDGPAAVILLGDMEARNPLDQELAEILPLTEVWWVHGNHDTDEDRFYDNVFGSSLANRNLNGRVVEIAGRRVAGLGGVFRGQVWLPQESVDSPASYYSPEDYLARCGKGNRWRGGLARKHRSTIFKSTWDALATERADILVTHEAPSAHNFGFVAIDELARRMGVKQAFHGHQHETRNYTKHRGWMGFDGYGVGIRDVLLVE